MQSNSETVNTQPLTPVSGYSKAELQDIYEKMEAIHEKARCMNMCDFANWPREKWKEMHEYITGRKYK